MGDNTIRGEHWDKLHSPINIVKSETREPDVLIIGARKGGTGRQQHLHNGRTISCFPRILVHRLVQMTSES